MSSISAEDSSPPSSPKNSKSVNNKLEITEANHYLPAGTSEDTKEGSRQHPEKDDPATMAASEELKHTTISDNVLPGQGSASVGDAKADKDMKGTAKAQTPEMEASNVRDEEMREQVSSPKKKRGRDNDDDAKESFTGSETLSVVNGRTARLEPEKKRPRDTSVESTKSSEKSASPKVIARCLIHYSTAANFSIGHSILAQSNTYG